MHTPMGLGGRPASESFVALPVDRDLMFFSFERGTVLGALPLSRVTNGEIDAPGKKTLADGRLRPVPSVVTVSQ